jgi:hypothetical protein
VTFAGAAHYQLGVPRLRTFQAGTQASISTGATGGGNFTSRVLHIGQRANNTLSIDGFIYSMIISGIGYSDETIAEFSDWTLEPRSLIS